MPEFEFNFVLAREILAMLRAAGFSRSFLIGDSGAPLELRERAAIAARGGARVLISIHHDSLQTRYLHTWTFQGRVREYTTHARGFSLFVSARNSFFAASKDLAVRIGAELRATDKRPSVHHAEPIEGEGRQVIDAVNGVYRFDDLVVLRTAAMPAVLLEEVPGCRADSARTVGGAGTESMTALVLGFELIASSKGERARTTGAWRSATWKEEIAEAMVRQGFARECPSFSGGRYRSARFRPLRRRNIGKSTSCQSIADRDRSAWQAPGRST